ncbi:hypothetical protein DSO57_1021728 [Entomophthora muscae]|uniref:Uncharacterized protein n=1 Tax=Entomophthora muscae TaxID=34485 RepID=A0ACC2UP46_9FUNG|nr:hypothetical protein DSO57_1021728 [Entomophthora muscae]
MRGGKRIKGERGSEEKDKMINPEQNTALPSQMSAPGSISHHGFTPVVGSDEFLNSELLMMYDNVFMNPMAMDPFQPIPNLPPMPDQFCTEFYEYDRQTYRQAPRKRVKSEEPSESAAPSDQAGDANPPQLGRDAPPNPHPIGTEATSPDQRRL